MGEIQYSELIISCEACGNVKKFHVKSEPETEKLFADYECENGCGKNLLSFIQLGQLKVKQELEFETT